MLIKDPRTTTASTKRDKVCRRLVVGVDRRNATRCCRGKRASGSE